MVLTSQQKSNASKLNILNCLCTLHLTMGCALSKLQQKQRLQPVARNTKTGTPRKCELWPPWLRGLHGVTPSPHCFSGLQEVQRTHLKNAPLLSLLYSTAGSVLKRAYAVPDTPAHSAEASSVQNGLEVPFIRQTKTKTVSKLWDFMPKRCHAGEIFTWQQP